MTVRVDILESAARTLARSPSATLADVAAEAGISRTTLFTRYPTREVLLEALALDALDRVGAAYDAAGVLPQAAPATSVLTELIRLLIPLGPRMAFLMRERSLDESAQVNERYRMLDEPLLRMIEAAQRAGELRADQSAAWLNAALFALVMAAWEQIEEGTLAPRNAHLMVIGSFLTGARQTGHSE